MQAPEQGNSTAPNLNNGRARAAASRVSNALHAHPVVVVLRIGPPLHRRIGLQDFTPTPLRHYKKGIDCGAAPLPPGLTAAMLLITWRDEPRYDAPPLAENVVTRVSPF